MGPEDQRLQADLSSTQNSQKIRKPVILISGVEAFCQSVAARLILPEDLLKYIKEKEVA